jgi:hypothetical protein
LPAQYLEKPRTAANAEAEIPQGRNSPTDKRIKRGPVRSAR